MIRCPICDTELDLAAQLLPMVLYGHELRLRTKGDDHDRLICAGCMASVIVEIHEGEPRYLIPRKP